MKTRRKFTDQFKAQIALEALRGDMAIQEIAAKHQIHPNQVSQWKRQAVDGLPELFVRGGSDSASKTTESEALHAKIERLVMENDFLSQGLKL